MNELPSALPGKTGWPWTEESPQLPDAMPDGTPWPRVSVVTPSYNQGQFLEETIRSVLLQGYPNLEFLIVDGGSTDGSVETIKRYAPWLAYWVSEPDRGQAHAINKGLGRSTGDFLGWLNSDDMLTPCAIYRAVQRLASAEAIDVVFGSADRIDARSNLVRSAKAPDDQLEFGLATMITRNAISQPGALWRRRLMDRVGVLDEDLHYVMDYEYWMRLALAGARFEHLPGGPLSSFRLSEVSKTSRYSDRFGLEILCVLDRLLNDPDVSEKLGLTPREARQQIAKGRARASLRIFRVRARREGLRARTLTWLIKAFRLHPAILVTKKRAIVAGLWDALRPPISEG